MVSAYLFVKGVDGPSTSKPNHIDILSINWGVDLNSAYGAGASGKEAKVGRAAFQNLSIMKVLDKSSTFLMDHCASGNVLEEVYILYSKPDGAQQADYFRIYLKDALITHFAVSGGGDNPTESLAFAFQAVEVAYKAEKDDGTLDAAVPKGYNLATAKADFAAPVKF